MKLSLEQENELDMLLKITLKYLFRKYINKDLSLSSKNIFMLKKKLIKVWSKGMTFSLFIFSCIPYNQREDFLKNINLDISKDRSIVQTIAIKAMNKIIKGE